MWLFLLLKTSLRTDIIRSTARHFGGQQHGCAWKCTYPKNKPNKNARNHGNL